MKNEELKDKLSDFAREILNIHEIIISLVAVLDKYHLANDLVDSDQLSNAFCGVAEYALRIGHDLDNLSLQINIQD